MTVDSDDAYMAMTITGIIEPFLAGRKPGIQSAILADLLAKWVAGHHPALRERILADHIALVVNLIPLAEQAQFGEAGHPGRKDMEGKA